jgi:hypothetical protein
MKLSCPTNPTHKRFSATAHEVRGWIVDESGSFIESDGNGCEQVASGPDFDSSVCMECGADAIQND